MEEYDLQGETNDAGYHMSEYNFIKKLGDDLGENTNTFLCKEIKTEKLMVVKLYTCVCENNEFQVMNLLHDKFPEFFVKPVKKEECYFNSISFGTNSKGLNLNIAALGYIVYPYIPGIPLSHMKKIDNVENIEKDIREQLIMIHSLGLIHTDVAQRNIIRDIRGKYRLIDYDLAYSEKDGMLTYPLKKVWDFYQEELPTKEEDFKELESVIKDLKEYCESPRTTF